MSTVQTCEKILLNTSKFIRRTLVAYGERKGIEKKKDLYSSVTLSPEQEERVQDFYQTNYGKRISTKWHRLYTSYTGHFCYDYFPEILFSSRLEPITNPYREAEFLDDKNLLHTLFRHVGNLHIPVTYLSCIRGVFHDCDMRIISKKEAEEIISKLDNFVIKKTIGTNSGKDVEIYKDGCESPKDTMQKFGTDFVVQEVIHQCKQLAAINSSSVNTFRVITYICNDEIHLCPTVLRIGRLGKDKDNMHYGGISVGINTDGSLKKTAYAEYGERFDAHPDSNLVFDGYRIPQSGDFLWNKAKELHSLVPCMGIISWDLTVDDSEQLTIIEMNTTGQSTWFNQFANGESLFGNDTANMLQLIRNYK